MANEKEQKRERSSLGKVMGVLGTIAVPAGIIGRWHMTRPRRPMTATDPSKMVGGLFSPGPHHPHYDFPKPEEAVLNAMKKEERAAVMAKVDASTRWSPSKETIGTEPSLSRFYRGTPSATVAKTATTAEAEAIKEAAKTGGTITEFPKQESAPPPPAPVKKFKKGATVTPGHVAVPNTTPGAGRNIKVGTVAPKPTPWKYRLAEGERFAPQVLHLNPGASNYGVGPWKGAPRIRAYNAPHDVVAPDGFAGVQGLPKPAKQAKAKGSRTRKTKDFIPPLSPDEIERTRKPKSSTKSKLTITAASPADKAITQRNKAAAQQRIAEEKAAQEEAAMLKLRSREQQTQEAKDKLGKLPVRGQKWTAADLQKRKKEKGTQLSALRRTVYFNEQGAGGLFTAADTFGSQYRRVRRALPWVNRGVSAAEDTGDIAAGKKVQDPFYKKTWFKMGALAAAAGAPLWGVRQLNKLAVQQKKFPNSIPTVYPKTGKLREAFLVKGQQLDDWLVKKKYTKQPVLTNPDLPALFAAVRHRRQLQLRARVRQIMFDLSADEKGWDLRDARGRSARVYAPGSRRRARREKSWDEKTDNIRAMRNVAIGGALAATGAGAFLYRKNSQAVAALTDAEKKLATAGADKLAATAAARQEGKTAAFDKMRKVAAYRKSQMRTAASLNPPQILASAHERRMVMLNSLHKLVDAGERNIEIPRPEFVDAINNTLDDRERRSFAKRLLGGAALIGGGALAGHFAGKAGGNKAATLLRRAADGAAKKGPKWGAVAGAGLGGLGAGLLLLR